MDHLQSYVQTHFPSLSDGEQELIQKVFSKQERKRGELLVEQGKVCRDLYFLAMGMTRSYSIKDDADITTWFSFQNDFITSFTSFFPQEPSYES
ncbi:MAG: Crp/Fnr family transcriptional regulator, partial [Bacteroidota bacterium]